MPDEIIKNYYIHKQNICRNCGDVGHLYRNCKKPIMSFGVICYRINNNNIEYLMIQRKDSLSFMEFIRGKYKLENPDYITRLLSNMTICERQSLLVEEFEELWNNVWCQRNITKKTPEFIDACHKFNCLRNGYFTGDNKHIKLYKLLLTLTTSFIEPEWGFPKGRRRLKEKDIECAVREFSEETGFHRNELSLVDIFTPYEEVFYGTNGVLYRHVYYIARITTDSFRIIQIDENNIHQVREVSQVRWFNASEVLDHIREYNTERRELFKRVHRNIQSHLMTLKGYL
jgi:8-oxo-dGTP pyrophosphatase MutT (NUDIX family)